MIGLKQPKPGESFRLLVTVRKVKRGVPTVIRVDGRDYVLRPRISTRTGSEVSEMTVYDVKIFLKSGQVVEFVTTSLKSSRDDYGNICKLEWRDVEGETTLHRVQLDQIAAITYKKRETGAGGG